MGDNQIIIEFTSIQFNLRRHFWQSNKQSLKILKISLFLHFFPQDCSDICEIIKTTIEFYYMLCIQVFFANQK